MQVYYLNSGERARIERLDGYSTKEQGNGKMCPVFLFYEFLVIRSYIRLRFINREVGYAK